MRTHSSIRALRLVFLPVTPAKVCDFCLISQGISPLETQRGSGLRITQRYALNDSVFKGTDEIDNPGAEERFWTTDYTGFYSVPQLEGLLLSLNVPLRTTKLDGHIHAHDDGEVEVHPDRGSDGGVGDLSLLARYTFLKHHTWTAHCCLQPASA